MAHINENFQKLPGSYLFAEIARRTAAYQAANPDKQLIKLGIGDVTRPLAPSVIQAMHKAVDEMGSADTFMGYGPYEGYDFLRQDIITHDYAPYGVSLSKDEIFVSDGAKSDCGNIGDIFSVNNVVAVCDPVYPVYVDANAMAGRAGDYDGEKWTELVYMPCTAENGFFPELPVKVPDMIYLCFPNNPTGMAATKAQLKLWVDYANEHGSVILYDSAYEAFIREDGIPHSIYEVPGAKTCAIEFRSYSKTAGFTGTRCAYTVIPKELKVNGVSLAELWLRRQSTKYNGCPYIIQRGAQAIYTEQGKREVKAVIDHYLENARIIREGLAEAGLTVYGGVNSPYVWAATPDGIGSWEFFDRLLQQGNVVTTPGAGFGPSGEGYIRLTGFGDTEQTKQAVSRIKAML
ncbi:MAG: LL-diaminopimelate aminotransferase [Oscillospiraceae bacterium]|jgi:LL-diaminopimelate aminotransferase|nr:LL-diaminopimelate aminotransferase [Oscillospiraceae bacterium]